MNYIYWLIVFAWSPILILWIINYKYLVKYKKTFIYCILWSLIFSIPWDMWAIKANIWVFPEGANLGVIINQLPIEEYFFMIFVTMFISTVVLLLKRNFLSKQP
jgi:lycopene cyclase domain-containing protein